MEFASNGSSRPSIDTTSSVAYPPIQYPHLPRRQSFRLSFYTDMDVYTTSFTYPRRSRHIHSPSSSLDYASGAELRGAPTEPFPTPHLLQQHVNTSSIPSEADTEAIAKLAMLAGTLHGCHVSYFLTDQGRGWNFHVTGSYQQVMITRGMILKECPVQVRCLFLSLSQ